MLNPNNPDQFKESNTQVSLKELVGNARDQHGVIGYEKTREIVRLVQEKVDDFARKHDLVERELLFCGLNEASPKDPEGEHQGSVFMGDYVSLSFPGDLASSEDLQAEHWVVNPILYALEGGTLAVYDRAGIEGDQNLVKPEHMDEDFGTLIVQGDAEQLRRHQIGNIQIYE